MYWPRCRSRDVLSRFNLPSGSACRVTVSSSLSRMPCGERPGQVTFRLPRRLSDPLQRGVRPPRGTMPSKMARMKVTRKFVCPRVVGCDTLTYCCVVLRRMMGVVRGFKCLGDPVAKVVGDPAFCNHIGDL